MLGDWIVAVWTAVVEFLSRVAHSANAAAWFSAVGTVAAVFVSLYLIRQQNQLRAREAAERERRQARAVHISYPIFDGIEGDRYYKFDPYKPENIPPGIQLVYWTSTIANASDDAISNVSGRIASVDEEAFSYLPDGGDFLAHEVVARLLPGEKLRITLKLRMDLTRETGYNNRGDLEFATYLQFTDAEGRVWNRDPRGQLNAGPAKIRLPGEPRVRVID
ncbi:hypothetical protein [Leifsonia shinshuensis]|uniref:hypothetical protein n=1 Tax=Leifsonia shinshuensis TaxID=150026 RepID=UPI0028644725|nr:hypothetical protein [Leifsonia shinshuensis]MDR6970840.1 hypothetical protein [Leifsonia shinshuensis]